MPRDYVVDLSVTPSTNTPCITLTWGQRLQANIRAQNMYRRLKGDATWVLQSTLTTTQTSYADPTAVPGVEYEYWMQRTLSSYPSVALGYISAGVNVQMVETRGTLLLVIDDTMLAPLAGEISQLQADLAGDGWIVQTIIALRTNSVATVKAQIKAAYDADTNNVKMVYLLGHVPVPYSGDMAPDGYVSHTGAWPADGYYGEMDGLWTDTSVNDTAAGDERNRNVPGDGKFDQSFFPSLVELMVGRVDLHSMTRAPSATATETALLRRYLRKVHDFRYKQGAYANIPRRSLIRDGFGYWGGENFAINGWSWALTGVGSTVDEAPADAWFSLAYAGGNSYLFGHGNGGGSMEQVQSIGNTADFGKKASRVAFACMFGSLFGDWDADNNLMRAVLAGNATGDSLGLTCFWSGRPNWFMHHMGMGETVGYATRLSENSGLSGGSLYQPGGTFNGLVHCGLLGDPALRLHMVEPPRSVAATSANGQILLQWLASTEAALQGYHVYRAATPAGPFTRLTASPHAGTTYTDATAMAGQSYTYLVRTLKREAVPGGTYYNLSVGSSVTLSVNAGATPLPLNPGNLAVTQSSGIAAHLSWTDNASDETGYRIERKTNAGGSYAAIGTADANATAFDDAGPFAQGNVYYYRVVATNAAGDSLPSNETSFEAVAGFFDLNTTMMKVAKSAGIATLTVTRFGGLTGAVAVNYATANDSAFAGTHYIATSGTLNWADGETGAKTLSVPLINTSSPQQARQFKVTLSNPTGCSGIGVFDTAAVLIEDPSAVSAPWAQAMLGSIPDGSPAVFAENMLGSTTLGGSGIDKKTAEAGPFIYQNRTGDAVMTAYISTPTDDGNALYVLMARAGTNANAVMACAAASGSTNFGCKLSYRLSAGAISLGIPSSANALLVPCWMRLTRSGNSFTSETSTDGSAWTTLGSATVANMPSTAQWGFFHYSYVQNAATYAGNYQLATATNVTLSGLQPPDAPSDLAANPGSGASIELLWTDNASVETGFELERRLQNGSFALVQTLVANTTNLTDSATLPGVTYEYRLRATNSSGNSAWTAIASATGTGSGFGTMWDAGGGSDTAVTNAINWTFNTVPAFDGSASVTFGYFGSTATVNTDVSYLGITFNRDCDFTLAKGAGTLTLGSGGISAQNSNTTARTYTIATDLILAANQTWGVAHNTGATTLVVSGNVGDGASSYGIIKTGSGTLTLAGNNSYDGSTVVKTGGILQIVHANALGSTVSGTVVEDGGRLDILGNLTTAEPISLSGLGPGNSGAFFSSGTNTLSGLVTLSSGTVRLNNTGGGSVLTLSGGITSSVNPFFILNTGGGTIWVTDKPLMIGGGTLWSDQGGTLVLGEGGNMWGGTSLSNVFVRTDVANAFPEGTQISMSGVAKIDLNGFDQTVNRIYTDATEVNTSITSAVPATLTLNPTTDTTFNGRLTGALKLVKGGANKLTLVGTNSFSGGVILNSGLLTVAATSSLGSGTSITVNAGILELQRQTAIADNATLAIKTGAKVSVSNGLSEAVYRLWLNGVEAIAGTWGSSGSGAVNVDDTYFAGSGMVNVLTGTAQVFIGTVWDGGSGAADTRINNPINWSFNTLPPFDGSTNIVFGARGGTATVNTAAGFLGIKFNRDNDFTLANGGGTLTLGAGSIAATVPTANSRTYTVAATVNLAAEQTWGITNNGAGIATLVISGAVADGASSFGITKTGDGVLTLAGNNSYDGPTVVSTGGVLRVAHANALGSTNGATTVMDGGWLEITGGVVVAESLTINGDAAVGNAGTLRSTGGTNAWAGAVTQGSTSRIRVLSGSKLTLSGGVTGSAAIYLTPDTNATLNITGLSLKVGGANVYANGAGAVGLCSTGNEWGKLEVAGLTVRMDAANALPATSVLSVGTDYSPDGTVDLNGNSQTVSQLQRVTSNPGKRLVTSATPATLTVNGTASPTYDGVLAGALSLVKSGSGTLYLSNTNTYTGTTVVSEGTLCLTAGSSLRGCPDITVAGGTLNVQTTADGLSDGATLRIADGGGAKVNMKEGVVETVGVLYLGGKLARRGTWGASGSGAAHIDSTHFSGTGVINVSHGPETIFLLK